MAAFAFQGGKKAKSQVRLGVGGPGTENVSSCPLLSLGIATPGEGRS